MTKQRRLLILALLNHGDMHGYGLNAHLGMTVPISLKKPTAYNILESLEREGLIHGSEESTGDRKRRVYALSRSGKLRYQEMLREQLADFVPAEHPGMASFSFLDDLPQDQARIALRERLRNIDRYLDELSRDSHPDGEHAGAGGLALEFVARAVALEREFVQTVLVHMEKDSDRT
jgi:DNA-binding PadR family transcriptional regulator